MTGINWKNILLGFSITGLLFGPLFNPMNLVSGLGFLVNAIIEPLHLVPTLEDEINSARYVPGDPYARYFDQIIEEGRPYLRYRAPINISENVYVALLDGKKLLADYQIKIENGKAVCYGKTPRTGGNASCGEPSVWVAVDKYAARRIAETRGFEERAYLAKDLFLEGHIQVYPKSKAFEYLQRLPEIIELARKVGL